MEEIELHRNPVSIVYADVFAGENILDIAFIILKTDVEKLCSGFVFRSVWK